MQSGDTCDAIVAKYASTGLTLTEFYTMNS
jgi:hypothetical protein